MGIFQLARNFQDMHESFFRNSFSMLAFTDADCDIKPTGVDSLLYGKQLETFVEAKIEACRVGEKPYICIVFKLHKGRNKVEKILFCYLL